MNRIDELNRQLGNLVASNSDINSNECQEVIREMKQIKDKEVYFKSLFGDNITIFDTFITIEDVDYNYILNLSDKDIFLPLYKHSSAGFNPQGSQIPRGYTDRSMGELISNFKISFDDYFGLRLETYIKYNNEFIHVYFTLKESKKMFHISGEYVDFRGGHRIDNVKLHTKELIFSNDFKSIKWGRGTDTALNSFCKYSTNETLKEWLTINKEILKG